MTGIKNAFVKSNVSKIKEAQAVDKPRRGASTPSSWFKASNNTPYKLRLLPPWTSEGDNAGLPYKKYYQHWNVGPNKWSMVCPASMTDGAEPCYICEQVKILKSTGTLDDEERANDMKVSRRFAYQLIDRADPLWTNKDELVAANPELLGTPKIQFISLGWQAHKKITDVFSSAEWGDLSDPFEGHDMNMTKTGTGNNTEYAITFSPKPTPLFEDNEKLTQVAETMFDMDDHISFRIPTYNNTVQLMNGDKVDYSDTRSLKDPSGGNANLPGKHKSPLSSWEELTAQGSIYTRKELVENRIEGAQSEKQVPHCYGNEPDPKDTDCTQKCPLVAYCAKTFTHNTGLAYLNGPPVEKPEQITTSEDSVAEMAAFLRNS